MPAVYTHISSPFGLPSLSGHHSTLSRLPCAVYIYIWPHYLPVLYIMSIVYTCQFHCSSCSHPSFSLHIMYLFCMSVSLFLLCKKDHVYHFHKFHIYINTLIVVQSLSHVRLRDPMDCSMPGFPVLHHLLELAQTCVHWVGDAFQPYINIWYLLFSFWLPLYDTL